MNKEEVARALDFISSESGLPLTAESDFETESQPIEIRIAGLNPLESFHLNAQRTPLTWVVDFTFDLFSGKLAASILNTISRNRLAIEEQVSLFSQFATVETNLLTVGEALEDQQRFQQNLQLRLISPTMGHLHLNRREEEIATFTELVCNALFLVNFILEADDSVETEEFEGQVEGNRVSTTCGKYERSIKNKILCLEHWGYSCQACGLHPEATYGPEGKKIIHVHHKTPLSLMDAPASVDPKRDLVPLCPNCHNFAHKRVPPYTVEEITLKILERAN
jgi:5-methylcytosine-specific restriction protein A